MQRLNIEETIQQCIMGFYQFHLGQPTDAAEISFSINSALAVLDFKLKMSRNYLGVKTT